MSKPTQLNPEISGFGCVGFFCFIDALFFEGRPGLPFAHQKELDDA
jgi:hypothetical protein